jgi:hypothetical protein
MNKQYKLANRKKFQVTYEYTGGKWSFRIGDFTLLTKCPGGKQTADAIAEILRNSWFRHGQIDGAARTAIGKLVTRGFRHLKDYHGPWDHNWSWSGKRQETPAELTVRMVPAEPVIVHPENLITIPEPITA